MLYRKSSPTPPRLLLRIVVTAGASALVAACSSDAAGSVPGTPSESDAQVPNPAPACGGGPCGSVGMPAADAADERWVGVGGGSVAMHEGGGGCGNGGVCGVMVMLPDSGDASVVVVGGGVLPSNPDSGIDATGPCHPCGVIIHPEGGFD